MKMNMSNKLIAQTILALAVSVPAWAQDAPTPPGAQGAPAPQPQPRNAVDIGDMRHHIYVMEGALARAVDFGAKKLNQEIRSVMPDVFMLAGEAQARGVYLDGYGVFFDVEVPMLRQSMMWSLRMMMDQGDTQLQTAIANLRKGLQQGVADPELRLSMEKSLRTLERQATPGAGLQQRVGQRGDAVVTPGVILPADPPMPSPASAPPPPAPVADKAWATDPNRAYTEAVQKALVDAMIDYSGPMKIGADEWLTVAARDNERRDSLAPQDPFEETVTMIYRIKGSDLQAYRANKIDLEEVRRRVKIGQF
jgi:hypothetical protein